MTQKARIAFLGHHGTTRLFLKVHATLSNEGWVDPAPGFMTFNSYWKNRILRSFPQASVGLFPNSIDWKRNAVADHEGSCNPSVDQKEFERAWRLDKVLRHQPSSQVKLLWLQNTRRCEQFLDDFKPSLVFSELLQSLPCYSLYSSCKRRGIPFIQLMASRLPGRMEFFVDETGIPEGLNTKSHLSQEARSFARAYIETIRSPTYGGPTYMKVSVKRGIRLKTSDFRKTALYLLEMIQGGFFEPTRRPWYHPFLSKWRAHKTSQRMYQPGYFDDLETLRGLKKKKVLFPLHITPEASTDLWAPAYADMQSVTKQIVSVLPEDWTLIMKEHPSAIFLQRPSHELKKLKELPRSILMSPELSNEVLFKECDCIVTINGTMGLEAMLKGKPVITLGCPFYDLSGNTLPCPNLKHLPRLLQESLRFSPDPHLSEEFIAAYYESAGKGFPVNPDFFPAALEKQNVELISLSIGQRFLGFNGHPREEHLSHPTT